MFSRGSTQKITTVVLSVSKRYKRVTSSMFAWNNIKANHPFVVDHTNGLSVRTVEDWNVENYTAWNWVPLGPPQSLLRCPNSANRVTGLKRFNSSFESLSTWCHLFEPLVVAPCIYVQSVPPRRGRGGRRLQPREVYASF